MAKRVKKTKEQHINGIVEYPQEHEEKEDSQTVYRDMFMQTEDERLANDKEEDIAKQPITNCNLTKPNRSWVDDPANLLFKIGEIVERKEKKITTIYKVVAYHRDAGYYVIKPSDSGLETPIVGSKLVKAAEGAIWLPAIECPYKAWQRSEALKKAK